MKYGMFQGETAAQNGMTARIGHRDPDTAGWKIMQIFRTFFLELLVHLQVVVKTKHEQIVVGAAARRRTEQAITL